MSRIVDTDDFIKRSKITHNDFYDYSCSIYTRSSNKICIICKKHGKFWQTACSHLKGIGCRKCGYELSSKKSLKNQSFFINKSKEIHGSKYDYSLSVYEKAHKKVNVICKEHGLFKITPSNHYMGVGCYQCGRESIKHHNKENPQGWSIFNWNNSAMKSKNFDSFKVYIIMCWNDNELFFKVGRTYTDIKRRFPRSMMPYQYAIIDTYIFDTAKEAFDKEVLLKRINKENKYMPLIDFNGKQECFIKLVL